jgi:hypothetical protein
VRGLDDMIKAIDKMNTLIMHMNGITPEPMIAKWKKEGATAESWDGCKKPAGRQVRSGCTIDE